MLTHESRQVPSWLIFDVRQKMNRLATILVMAGMVSGCTSIPKEGSSVVGHYAMVRGGFNESLNVYLARDGSYVLDHKLFTCVIGPSSEMPVTYSKEEGTWTLDGRLVVLEPKAQTKDFPDASVFVPALARRLVPKRVGFSRLLVNADDPEHFVLRKTKKPSDIFEPAS